LRRSLKVARERGLEALGIEPLGTGLTYDVECNLFVTMSIGPGTCDLTQDGSRLTQDCGGGFVYTGTRSGASFSMSLARGVIPD